MAYSLKKNALKNEAFRKGCDFIYDNNVVERLFIRLKETEDCQQVVFYNINKGIVGAMSIWDYYRGSDTRVLFGNCHTRQDIVDKLFTEVWCFASGQERYGFEGTAWKEDFLST